MKVYPKKYYIDIFAILILFILGVKYLNGFERFIDIALYDESNYLEHGINIFRSGFPNAQSSPLYSAWYYFLSLFQYDTIKLYYLNYELLTIFLPITIYCVMRRYLVPLFPSFLISVFLLVSYTNFAAFPKVCHFAIILIMFSLVISSYFNSYFNKLTVVLISSFLISYVRPEFFISFLLLSVVYMVNLAYNFKSFDLIKLYKFSASALLIIISISFIGLPFSTGERSFLAFSQHFSLNWVNWEKSNLSPWSRHDSNKIIRDSFNDSKTIIECYKTNPAIFLKAFRI